MGPDGDANRAAYSKVIARCWSDPEYKARLLANPEAVLAEGGVNVPPDVKVTVADASKEWTLVIPPAPASGELPDAALRDASGGAYPTAVNNQITDAVSQTNVRILG